MSWVVVGVAAVTAVGSAVSSNQQKQAAKGASAAAERANQLNLDTSQGQYAQTRADYQPFAQAGYGAQNLLNRAAGIPTEGTFDPKAYLAANPDIAADPWASNNPYEHYTSTGQYENRGAKDQYFTGANNGTPDLSAFTASPGYQFRLGEGQKAQNNAFAASGGAFSGNALKALAEYNQNMASNEYGNWWNQLSDIANRGQNAVAGQATAGAQNVNNIIGSNNQNSLAQQNALMAQGDARASGVMGVTNALSFGLGNYGGNSGRAALNNWTPAYRWGG